LGIAPWDDGSLKQRGFPDVFVFSGKYSKHVGCLEKPSFFYIILVGLCWFLLLSYSDESYCHWLFAHSFRKATNWI